MRSPPSLRVLWNGLRSPSGRSHAALVRGVGERQERRRGDLPSCRDDAPHAHRLPASSPVTTKSARLGQAPQPRGQPPLRCAGRRRL